MQNVNHLLLITRAFLRGKSFFHIFKKENFFPTYTLKEVGITIIGILPYPNK